MSEEDNKEINEEMLDEEQGSSKPLFSLRRFVYIFFGLLALMVMFDEGLRDQMAGMLGVVLYPVIGFGGQYPILSLMGAGIIMVTFSTIVRHFFMDWVEMAENQKKSSAFQKELMEAKKANQTTKVKKMEKIQPEMSKLQMKSFKPQLKSMAITMIVVISIFGWCWIFLEDLPNVTYSVPWAFSATLTNQLAEWCFMPFPQWIAVKMLITLPFTQILMVTLKMIDFKKRLKEGET